METADSAAFRGISAGPCMARHLGGDLPRPVVDTVADIEVPKRRDGRKSVSGRNE